MDGEECDVKNLEMVGHHVSAGASVDLWITPP